MRKLVKFSLFILPLSFSFLSTLAAEEEYAAQEPQAYTAEEEEWITDRDRDRGSREKPNLYDYNRQNVQYINRYQDGYQSGGSSNTYYYSQPAQDDSFNRSNIQDNTSPYIYYNR